LADVLEAEVARQVYVDGGPVVSQSIAADLLDDLTISAVPVVLGDGIRLLQETRHERRLNLAGSEAFANGLVQLRYRLQAAPAET
jgi:dihydrofolate reductase